MKIDHTTWQAIAAATRTEIDRMNDLFKEHRLERPFSMEMRSVDDHEILITRRGARERRAVARHSPTGELRKATIDDKGASRSARP